MKTPLVIILVLVLNTSVFGQGQANVWYVGNGAGLDFNSVPPLKLQNGNAGLLTFTGEGVGAMSDANGNLLFYTNGNIVYDNTHTAMTNGTGLNGNGTTMQTGTIVPKIGSSSQYYILSPMDTNGTVKYSIVDMTLSSGKGDVVVASKNTLLKDTASEACLVIPHSNGTDFWVVLHASHAGIYWVYLFASGGITGPTSYTVGSNGFSIMQMKVNSCYNKIASVFFQYKKAEIVSFNNSTGAISATGMVTLTNFINNEVYGAEFSPNGRFIYISESGLNARKTVYQFDLQAGNDAAINASRRYFTGDATVVRFGTLQLGPDAKIYVPGYTTVAPSYMSVIPTPDVQWATSPATSSEFQYLQYTFNVKRVGEGLPPIIRRLLTSVKVLSSNACEGSSTNLSYSFGSTPSLAAGAISWDYGDGQNAQDVSAPTHTYNAAGTYNVSVTVIDTCGNSRTGTASVIIKPGPQVTIPTACPNSNVVLTGTGTNAANYTWSNNSSGSPVIATGTTYTYNGSLPQTVYVQDPTPLITYTVGNPSNPPNGNAGADVGYTYFTTYSTLTITSFQIYSRAAGSANLSLQNSAGTTTYWGPTACNPTAASQTYTFTPNVSLAAGTYRFYTSLKTPFFRENGSVDGGRNVGNVIDILGEQSGTKGGSFLNIGISLPDPCGIRTLTINNTCSLPVGLTSFDATRQKDNVRLDWTTASENNNNYFIIQKRTEIDPTVFNVLNVKGAGNSTTTKNYSAVDNHPYKGVSYYRLAQEDINGERTYSDWKKVSWQLENNMLVSPIPFSGGVLNISLPVHPDFLLRLTITDLRGKIIYQEKIQKEIASNTISFSGLDFPANGVYMLTAEIDGSIYHQKISVAKD